VLISSVDPVTDEVAAFEELVGSHGGLGGWQTDAMLVHPADWQITHGDLDGPDAVHRQLVEWLELLGLRARVPAARELVDGAAPELQGFTQAPSYHDGAAARLSPSRDR